MRFSNSVRFLLGFVLSTIVCSLVFWLGGGIFERGEALAVLAMVSIWLGTILGMLNVMIGLE